MEEELSGLLVVPGRVNAPLNVICEVHRHLDRVFLRVDAVPMHHVKRELNRISDHLLASLDKRFPRNMGWCFINVSP